MTYNDDAIEDLKDMQELYKNISGEYYTRITEEDLDNFEKLGVNKKSSYIVISNSEKALKKFMFIYILTFYHKIRHFSDKFEICGVKSYVDGIMNGTFDMDENKVLLLTYDRYFSIAHVGDVTFEKVSAGIGGRLVNKQISIVLAGKPIEDEGKCKGKFNLSKHMERDVKTLYLRENLTTCTLEEYKKDNTRSSTSNINIPNGPV